MVPRSDLRPRQFLMSTAPNPVIGSRGSRHIQIFAKLICESFQTDIFCSRSRPALAAHRGWSLVNDEFDRSAHRSEKVKGEQ
jgi:hypothetical protein